MFTLVSRVSRNASTDLLSGLTVALALVPEAVAFAFVAGVHPLVGLYAAFMVGLITAVFGGRPGMISGATGALAVVMVALVAQHGVEYLFATVVLMGIIQIIAGAMQTAAIGFFASSISRTKRDTSGWTFESLPGLRLRVSLSIPARAKSMWCVDACGCPQDGPPLLC